MQQRESKKPTSTGVAMVVMVCLMVVAVMLQAANGQSLVDDDYWPQMSEEELDNLEVVRPDFSLVSATPEDEHNAVEFRETPPPPQKWPPGLVERLAKTNAVNMHEVLEGMQIPWKYFPEKPWRYTMNNPYWPPHKMEGYEGRGAKMVLKWFANMKRNTSVCAMKWKDANKIDYQLKTFHSRESVPAGWIITHDKGCGACSTLKDLSIYMGRLDLTTPVRSCSQKMGLVRTRDCLIKNVELTPLCAEAWAYCGANTKLFCSLTCLKDYGLVNLILGNFPPDNLPDGSLRKCILCDELRSGPGFKYGAGRTRRNSGIVSSIERNPDELPSFPIDHTLYFK